MTDLLSSSSEGMARERIAAVCGAENGAAAVDRQRTDLSVSSTVRSGPDEAVNLGYSSRAHGWRYCDNTADDSVEAGAIAAAVGKAEYANLISHDDLSVKRTLPIALRRRKRRRSEVPARCHTTEAAEMRTCGWRRSLEFHGSVENSFDTTTAVRAGCDFHIGTDTKNTRTEPK